MDEDDRQRPRGRARPPLGLWLGWMIALPIATGAAALCTSFWIAIRAPHAFGARDAHGGVAIAVAILLAGLVVGLAAWITAALLARSLARRSGARLPLALAVLAPLAAIALAALAR